jgi:phenylpropionate dioxygenase-like ring-hydroxylating dioxygenase large terminal subunit
MRRPHAGYDEIMIDDVLKHACWHLICHRSEVARPNDFLRLSWFGEDVTVFNDSGEVIAFDNLCPHRGTRFFVDDFGNAPALCPYHGWRLREGAIHVPRKEKFSEIDLSKVRLNAFCVAWVGDFLFVSVAPRQSIEEQLGGAAGILESISRDIAGRFDFNAYPFECNWRVALENALEPYHIDMVHSSSLGSLKLDDGTNQFFGHNAMWEAPVTQSRTAKQLQSFDRLFRLQAQRQSYLNLYIFPFAMLSSTYGYSYSLQNFFPTSEAHRTQFYSRLLVSHARDIASAAALQSFFESTAAMNRKVFEEDHIICRRVSRLALDWNRPSIFASNEVKLRHFRESYSHFLTEAE